jgi:hypothetical protein
MASSKTPEVVPAAPTIHQQEYTYKHSYLGVVFIDETALGCWSVIHGLRLDCWMSW